MSRMTQAGKSKRAMAIRLYLEGETLEQVGRRLEVTKMRICQFVNERSDAGEIKRLHRLVRRKKAVEREGPCSSSLGGEWNVCDSSICLREGFAMGQDKAKKEVTITESADGIDKITCPNGSVIYRETPSKRIDGCVHESVSDIQPHMLSDQSGLCDFCHRSVWRRWLPPLSQSQDKWHWGRWH